MALTKYFVILFLVYLNFEISPLNSAVIPERYVTSDIVNKSDETTTASSENYATTVTNDDDIEKIFESYENQYIKNSNWFNDDAQLRNIKDTENDHKSMEVKAEENSTPQELETTEPTADDVVESIHNIMDDKIETKTNRTDRTIVVVVTTNVFNVNGSDDSGKRQHTFLSFGRPGMIPKPTSTDASLEMHNKITTEFFNSNPSPITEQSGIVRGNGEKLIANEGNEFHDENDFGQEIIVPETEDEIELDISTTEKPKPQEEYYNFNEDFNNIDIRRLRDSLDYNSAIVEGRNLDDTLSNDNSNDVLRIIIPSRSEDEINMAKPFHVPIQEPQDTSLMEAMENILDSDVREAFERDIPETNHVPLDINIEEEALYAPLKDLNEYIVEEVPVNYDILKENENNKADENKAEVTERWENEKVTEPLDDNQVNEQQTSFKPIERIDDLVAEPITESYTPDVPSTGPTITTTTAERTDTFQSNVANRHIDQITLAENEDSLLTTTQSNYFLDNGTESFHNDDHDDHLIPNEENILSQEELLLRSETSVTDNISGKDETSIADDIPEENDKILDADQTKIPSEEVPEITQNTKDLIIDDDFKYSTEPVETITPGSFIPIETDRRLRHTDDNESEPEAVNVDELAVDFNKNLNQPNNTFIDDPLSYDENSTLLQNIDDENVYEEGSSTSVRPDDVDIVIKNGKSIFVIEMAKLESEMVKVDEETLGQHKQIDVTVPIRVHNTDDTNVFEERSMISIIPSEGDAVTEETSGQYEQLKETIDGVRSNPQPFVQTGLSDDTNISKEINSNTVNSEKVELDVEEVDEATSEHLENIERAISPFLSTNSLPFLPIGESSSTTTNPNEEDVVSEVVKVDEETTEQHQIIKKPGVNESDNNSVKIKAINVNNVVSNELLGTNTASSQSRSFSGNDEPVDPLRTLVEGVELTAEITKTFDHFQSFANPNSAIHYAANQVVETKDGMELVNNNGELNSLDPSESFASATLLFIAAGVLSIGLIVLLGVFAVVRYRQFKRNILFSC